jgi:hypothetical protein
MESVVLNSSNSGGNNVLPPCSANHARYRQHARAQEGINGYFMGGFVISRKSPSVRKVSTDSRAGVDSPTSAASMYKILRTIRR